MRAAGNGVETRAPDGTVLARRRRRNIALAVALVALVVLFYFVTIVKMAGNMP